MRGASRTHVGSVDAGAVLEQQTHHGRVPALRGNIQRRSSVLLCAVDVGLGQDQALDDLRVPFARGGEQRRRVSL